MKKSLTLGMAAFLLLTACDTPAALVKAVKVLEGTDSSSGSSNTVTASKTWPSTVKKIDVKTKQTVSVQGNFDNSVEVSDLSWASSSSMACFPATQNSKFRGYHAFYSVEMPARTEMVIRVIPKDSSANMSLYAYQIGTTRFDIPPKVASAVSCEASFQDNVARVGQPGFHRVVTLNSTTNPYNVLIGVTGPADVDGEYTLEIELK